MGGQGSLRQDGPCTGAGTSPLQAFAGEGEGAVGDTAGSRGSQGWHKEHGGLRAQGGRGVAGGGKLAQHGQKGSTRPLLRAQADQGKARARACEAG